jgi:hypothetical protein
MEMPNPKDFDNEQDYEQAMNMWAHDCLYGWDEDRRRYEDEQEYEHSLLNDDESEATDDR